MVTFERHAKAAVQALAAMLAFSVLGFFLIPAALHDAMPPAWMHGATLEWAINASPLNGAHVGPHTGSRYVTLGLSVVIVLGAIAAAVYGAWTLRVVPVIVVGMIFGILLGLADFALERNWGVAVWTDRIEVRGGDAPRVYRPADVVRVEAACHMDTGRGSASKAPSVAYRLVFADEAYVDFAGARPSANAERSAWLHRVSMLDRIWGAGVPKVLSPDAAADPAWQARCMRRLETELARPEVAVARRVLGLDAYETAAGS